MINRILGWLFTIVVLAVIVFAVLNRGNYTSMLERDAVAELVEVMPTTADVEEAVVEMTDSVTVALPEGLQSNIIH